MIKLVDTNFEKLAPAAVQATNDHGTVGYLITMNLHHFLVPPTLAFARQYNR